MSDSNTPHTSSKDPAEMEFRKKNQWHSFKSSLYHAVSGAAFFGLLTTLVKAIIDYAAGGEAAAHALPLFGVSPLLVMGAFGVLGTAFVYMAEREGTKLKVLGDEHVAMLEAKQQSKLLAMQKEQASEPAQNQQADSQRWSQAVRQEPPLYIGNQV